MDHSSMSHGTERSQEPCEHCENQTDNLQTVLTNDEVSISAFAPVALVKTIRTILLSLHTPITLQTHLAAADPPIAPTIVRTIVLRT